MSKVHLLSELIHKLEHFSTQEEKRNLLSKYDKEKPENQEKGKVLV